MKSYQFHTCLTARGQGKPDCLRYYIDGKRVSRAAYDLKGDACNRKDTFWSKTSAGRIRGGYSGYVV